MFKKSRISLRKSGNIKKLAIMSVIATTMLAQMLVFTGCGKKNEVEGGQEGSIGTSTEAPVVSAPEGMNPSENQALISLMNTYYAGLRDGDSAAVETVKNNVTEEEKIRLETRAADIERYDNVIVYDEPGVNAGEYIVLVYSEIKFVGIETKAPGLQATYVTTDANGVMHIDSNVDENTMTYVQQVVSNANISDYYARVQVAYSDAITADASLYTYMDTIDAKLDQAVAARQQEMAAAYEEPVETAEAAPVTEIVTAKEKVNVRVSDSENADRLGQVEGGTQLTRYEVRENGWSKVDYNGQEGYIKSEFLQSSSDAAAAATTTDTAATTDTTATDATATTTTGGNTMTAKENVRVRNVPNTDSDDSVIGQLTGGATVEVIENGSNGWSKIKYNGQEGYVKTEFLQ